MSARRYDVVVLGGGIVGTHVADWCAEKGLSVAVVEKGPADVRAQHPAEPEVIFPQRRHEGAVTARNHVLGGNAHYWGGGLIRNRPGEEAALLGAAPFDEAERESMYAAVEKRLHLRRSPARSPLRLNGLDDDWGMAEMRVLLGKRRNVAAPIIARAQRSAQIDIFHSGRVCALERRGNLVCAVSVETQPGETHEVAGKHFILSMGALDSILFCLDLGDAAGLRSAHLIGLGVHDHWSIPLFDVRAEQGKRFPAALAPRFDDGCVVGRRFEMQLAAGGWNPAGLLHLACQFDDVSPYRETKALLSQRQLAVGQLDRALAFYRLLKAVGPLFQLAWYRLFLGQLYVSAAVPVVATFDFESFPSAENRIRLERVGASRRAVFEWDIRAEDEAAFERVFPYVERLLKAIIDHYGLNAEPVSPLRSSASLASYLKTRAQDAYHLGGGLPVGLNASESLVRPDLRFHGVENLYLLSSAAFRRPGIANPTLTLLALAWRLTRQIPN